MRSKRDAGSIKLSGGALCLDFANTVHCHDCADPGEYLNSYDDLVAWSRHVGTASDAEAKALRRRAALRPGEAKSVYVRAVELRKSIYGIFTILLKAQPNQQKDLAVFNGYLAEAMKQSQIVKTQDGFYWEVAGDKANLDWILNPIIRSAADLLVSEEISRVKICSDPHCGWLFLDVSRNRSRRWCDMRDCGNRAKASRFYKKKKKSKTGSVPSKLKDDRSRSESGLQRHLL